MALSVDRINGVTGDTALKTPVRVATTANITLSGLQTIDGVLLAAGDRVLVKNQTDPVDNGIWSASTSSWSRALDFDGAYDAVRGTLVEVVAGTLEAGSVFRLDTDSPVIGTSSLTFTRTHTVNMESDLASQASGKGAGLSGFSHAATYDPGTAGATLKRAIFVDDAPYNAPAYPADASTAILAAIADAETVGGDVFFSPRKYRHNSTLTLGNGTDLDVWSTKPPVKLRGIGAAAGVGDPTRGTILEYGGTGTAIQIRGPLSGWGVEDIMLLAADTSVGTTIGISLISAQNGTVRNVAMSFFALGLKATTTTTIATTQNVFDRLGIYTNPSYANSIGLQLTGGAGSANTTVNTFLNTVIQPTHVDNVCIWLGYSDTNAFVNTSLGAGFACTNGILFDYTVNTSFPCTNTFWQLAVELNKFNLQGTPADYAYGSPNKVYAFGQDSTVQFPTVAGLPLAFDRLKLVRDTTFYVKNDGSDTTGSGLTGNHWQTLQHAWDTICKHYDLNGFEATIELLDATYTGGALVATKRPTDGSIRIKGQVGGTAITVAGVALTASDNIEFTIQNLTLAATGGASALRAYGGKITVDSGCTFAASTVPHVSAARGGRVEFSVGYAVSGGATIHWLAESGTITCVNKTLTITGSPAFSAAFAYAFRAGTITATGNTYTGGATGSRYSALMNGVVDTNTGSATTLPGGAAGSTASGGQYN